MLGVIYPEGSSAVWRRDKSRARESQVAITTPGPSFCQIKCLSKIRKFRHGIARRGGLAGPCDLPAGIESDVAIGKMVGSADRLRPDERLHHSVKPDVVFRQGKFLEPGLYEQAGRKDRGDESNSLNLSNQRLAAHGGLWNQDDMKRSVEQEENDEG
jgi:hypothetical protein